MNLERFFLIILIGISLASCQSKPSSEAHSHSIDSSSLSTKPKSVAELETTILSLHDSVMPAMSDLMKLRKEVTKHLTELDKQPALASIKEQKEQGLNIYTALVKADDAMMSWMNQYKGDTLVKLDEQQALAYLKDQQQKINDMTQLMQKSILDAKVYLKK